MAGDGLTFVLGFGFRRDFLLGELSESSAKEAQGWTSASQD